MANLKNIEELQFKAIQVLKKFKSYSDMLNRYNSENIVTSKIEYTYIPINRAAMNELLDLKLQADVMLDEEVTKDSFYTIMKLIKPDCTIFKYRIKEVSRYQLITSKEKIIKYLPGERERRINIIKKKNQTFIDNNDFSEDMIKKIKKDESEDIAFAIDEVEKIIENPSNYEVFITTAEDNLSYPALYINYYRPDGSKDRYDEHLRENNIPNVFVYEAEETTNKYANNKRIKNLKAKGASYLLGTILYMEKDTNE